MGSWSSWWRRWWDRATGRSRARAEPAHAPRRDPPSADGDAAAAASRLRRRQRERVALLVREVMLRHGVLSGRYRVRVLSLDREGQQHLVLIDWLPQPASMAAGPAPHPTRLEAQVRDDALQLLGLQVRAVYWRGDPPATQRPRPDARRPDGEHSGA
ncbi:hypothetical protein [uncultured Tepidimonas sp.]|uniref:hypothetical protein n=1 Tax=unclassified Tepidimonas TaxID=2631705 RepID=UPI002623850A|nr:hypothetical protein [uncultured Tepidimonas sp.]